MTQGSIIFTARPEARANAPVERKDSAYARIVRSMTRIQTRWIGLFANVALWALIIRFSARFL